MELLVMCFVVAALVQHAAKDAFAGVTGRTFPSQAYRMKRLELRALADRIRERGRSARSGSRVLRRAVGAGLGHPVPPHAGLGPRTAGALGTPALRRGSRGRQAPKPAREFARVWWHTGPSQRWADAWRRAADKRARKLVAANEPADKQPDVTADSEPGPAPVAAVDTWRTPEGDPRPEDARRAGAARSARGQGVVKRQQARVTSRRRRRRRHHRCN